MSKNKKILILASDQFGFSTTLFKYCEYALNNFDFTYVCWDYNLSKVKLPGVSVIYVSRESNLIVRNFNLLQAFHKEIQFGYDLVFVTYSRGISIVKLLNPHTNFAIYIDTLGVTSINIKRAIYDLVLKLEVSVFEKIAVISNGVGNRLGLQKYHILPLGGERYSSLIKPLEQLCLLYVGTLSNRNILESVKGFHKYIKLHSKNKTITILPTYTIVGDGPNGELEEIRDYIKNNNLEKYIFTTGYVPQRNLVPIFNQANIGVSYVPIRSYYQYQPPTKTYEYLISGFPVIATATLANKSIVESEAGVLIDDNPTSFYNGIIHIQKQKQMFNRGLICEKYAEHTWKRVVEDKFIPLMEQLIEQRN